MLTELSCSQFSMELALKKPVPGGGGAAAFVAALGIALNTMVANFSYGKKKFIDNKEEHERLISKSTELRERFICLVDKDAELFEPLSKAYAMPSNNKEEKNEKEKVLQVCLKSACSAPYETLELTYDAIGLHKEILPISSKNIISDVGVGVQCLKAALNSAYLNVLINLNSINDEEYVSVKKEKAEKLVMDGTKMADEVYEKVLEALST